jgi:hypothetical protein
MPQTMRASSFLELPQTSMVKNLKKKSPNAYESITNGLRNVQKPLAGLLQHLIWSKTEEVMLSAIFLLQACCLLFAISHLREREPSSERFHA